MTTNATEIQSNAALEFLSIQQLDARPTDAQLDKIAEFYVKACEAEKLTSDAVKYIETQAIALVQKYGLIPAHAEKSRRLSGHLSEYTLTKADTLVLVEDRIADLKEVLEGAGYPAFFVKLFLTRTKYEVVEGATDALKTESLPKRLAERVQKMWGACINVKPKKASIKITLADPAKPAKKTKKAKVA